MNTRPRIQASHSARAFTLIELLTVIAIIGILAAIIIPTVGKVRATAKKSQCLSNMRQWGMAVRLFSNDYKGMVALYNNLGAATGTSDPKIYSRYFGQTTMTDPLTGAARPSQEAMSKCPLAVSDTSSSEYRQRCYAFVRGGGVGGSGMKRVPLNTFGLDDATLVSCYNIADASAPSLYVLMAETHSPSNSAVTVDDANASYTQHVRPMQVNTDPSLVRHSGAANMLFVDGHVASFSSGDTDYSNPANRERMTRWFTLK